ncbi:MAG: alternative ribosome rescue aminoacyl-tRNA hydrolase ArfB [Desulfobacterales bacterium]
MIHITKTIAIQENEIESKFMRSPGPGGQNVNKVSSAVQLRFNVLNSPSLPEGVRRRLLKSDYRITAAGILIINAHRFRSQELNRKDALNRLIVTIRKAVWIPKPRLKTRPSLSSQRKRLARKHRHSTIKKTRMPVRFSDS